MGYWLSCCPPAHLSPCPVSRLNPETVFILFLFFFLTWKALLVRFTFYVPFHLHSGPYLVLDGMRTCVLINGQYPSSPGRGDMYWLHPVTHAPGFRMMFVACHHSHSTCIFSKVATGDIWNVAGADGKEIKVKSYRHLIKIWESFLKVLLLILLIAKWWDSFYIILNFGSVDNSRNSGL